MIQTIKELVEVETGIKDIAIKTRKQPVVDAKTIYAVLCLRHTKGISYERIGELIGRDHSSITHYKKLFNDWQRFPRMFSEKLNAYKRVNDVLERGREEVEEAPELYVMYKKENILLRKENAALQATMKRLEQRIKELEKYEPIW